LNELAVMLDKLGRHEDAVQIVKQRLDTGTKHGNILPPPDSLTDALTEYFFEAPRNIMSPIARGLSLMSPGHGSTRNTSRLNKVLNFSQLSQ
jgi:hypothetical protein